MELIDQHTKSIMEGCKERARDAGLRFEDETLEYILTNRDLLELSPKAMIPTLYDYWVHDVEVLKEKGKYELYPSNPYETVINTRPAISFYNDNNPDWLNVMIFYHVLAHIDFFQNNLYFQHTWDYDFNGQALSDKRVMTRLRSEKGRWVDYIIEFSRGLDNLVGFYPEVLSRDSLTATSRKSRFDFYFDVFLQAKKDFKINDYVKEIERYNTCVKKHGKEADNRFFSKVRNKHPEFEAHFKKSRKERPQSRKTDIIQYVMEHSPFLKQEGNAWMRMVMEIVRKTSLFFQPQIRTKIMNEGWASYWHEKLFLDDERIRGHETDFARVHSLVTALPRVGLNPYALGMRLFSSIEESADRGRYTMEFERLLDQKSRKAFNQKTGSGRDLIFHIRANYCDFTFINRFTTQEFVTAHKLFVTERRLNRDKMVWEYVITGKSAEAYKQMLMNTLYHPPHIEVEVNKSSKNNLYLVHHFEDRPLVQEFIKNTMMGIEYLWGGPVQLETSELDVRPGARDIRPFSSAPAPEQEVRWKRVRYTMKDKQLSKVSI